MKGYKRLILLLLIVLVVTLNFYNQYTSSIQDIQFMAKSKEAQMNRYIDLSKGCIDLITIYGNDFLKHGGSEDSNLLTLLNYGPKTNCYDLDAIEGKSDQYIAGNLTGIGPIPKSGIDRDEINMALHMNQDFSSIYNKIPDLAWIYYTSKNNFINIYPWISSKNFRFSHALQTEKFFTYVTPQNDPMHESVWTPVYLDHAGKGLMVTLTSPIYYNNTFMGAVSLDFTNNRLSEIVKCDYDVYLIDETGSVMATSLDIKFDTDIIKVASLLNTTDDEIKQMKDLKRNKLHRVGNYFYYAVSFNNAPWEMYLRVPVSKIVGRAILFSLPILIICLLLLFTLWESEKRKQTEKQLKQSLQELTSYQTLLENAAKYDFLTSTVNRRGLIDIFNKHFEDDTSKQIIFIMGDIDNFKQFNDTYGHAAGDKVLKEIAAIIQRNIEHKDVICRWGGEEFIIMLLDKSFDEAIRIAEHIRQEIENTVIPWENSLELKATMTFGVAEHDFSNSFDNSISKADAAMYLGKKRGRNQVVSYRDI